MKKGFALLLALSILLMGVSAFGETAAYTETVVSIEASGHVIPATLCMPAGEGPFPAVVMLHGTASSRDEAGGGYKLAAPVLAEKYGLATIRIDFMGNGESTADYKDYNFETAVGDALAAANYMSLQQKIDGAHIGVMGWSQGGTIALLAAARSDVFSGVVTWAGAPDMKLDGFFAQSDYDEAKANGYFVMEFDWRDALNVGLQWCEDVMKTDVLGEFSAFKGPVLAIAGTADTTVDPVWSEKIVAASSNAESALRMIDGMDHTFNVFADPDYVALYEAVNATGEFFAKTLK